MLKYFNKNFFRFSFGFVGMLMFGFFGIVMTGYYQEASTQPEGSMARDAVDIPSDDTERDLLDE